MSADRLHESSRRWRQLHGLADVVEGDRRKRGLLRPDGDGGRAHQASAVVAGVDDRAVDHLDPADEMIGEAEPVGGPERVEVFDWSGGGSS